MPHPDAKTMLCAGALAVLLSANPVAAQTGVDPTHAVAEAIRHLPALNAPLRGSVTLPRTGADMADTAAIPGAGQVSINWQSSNRAVLSDRDRVLGGNVIRAGSVYRGSSPIPVRLTARVSAPGASPIRVPIDLTVPARPHLSRADLTAYMFVYFTNNSIEGEKLRFATSDGNNALQWQELNGGKPVLESRMGTQGLRDPFIMRSAEGDRFFLLATDLSAGRTGWATSTDRGSRFLEIWESTDLVHWGNQRHVEVNLPNAGMTWAPEASYDSSIDAYVVYWTSRLFTDAGRTQEDGNGPQIMMSITRDFRNFTPPVPWFKAADLPELVKQKGMIDTTVLKDGQDYYRFTKVTQQQGCPSADILAQRSRFLRATNEAWQVVDRCIGRHAGTPEVEGPSAFLANPGDTSGFRYFLWVDNYTGVGYIPLATNALTAPISWVYPKTFHLPASPRHGSILAITAKERDALAQAWAPELLVTAVAPVALSVRAGARSVALPPSVTATFKDGHTARIAVHWPAVDRRALMKPGGSVTVRGQLANSAAIRAIAHIKATGPAQEALR